MSSSKWSFFSVLLLGLLLVGALIVGLMARDKVNRREEKREAMKAAQEVFRQLDHLTAEK